MIDGGASRISSSAARSPQRSLITALCPPMVLAEPCSRLLVVTPPASWRYRLMSVASSTSATRTSATTLSLASLMPRAIAMCECASINPGVRCIPLASTSVAPAGSASPLPTAAMRPPLSSTSVFASRPAGPCVHTVAPRISVVCSAGGVTP